MDKRRRVSARLPRTILESIATMSADKARTEVIEEALSRLCKDLQHDRLPAEFIETLTRRDNVRTPRQMVHMRLPIIILDYLQLNTYNLTTCITTALKLYYLP